MQSPKISLPVITFLFFSFIFFIGFSFVGANGQSKPCIAILNFEGRGISAMEAATLTDRLREHLMNTGAFVVIDRDKTEAALQEIGFQQSDCVLTACALQVGKMLTVQKVMTGSIGKLGKMYTFVVSVIDVESSRIERALMKNYQGEVYGLLETVNAIAKELASTTKSQPPAMNSKPSHKLTNYSSPKDWIDLSDKSDPEIARILEWAVASFPESPAVEANKCVRLLQIQAKDAKLSFDQKTILLEGELSAAAAAKEAAEKSFSDMRADLAAIDSQLDLYARSQQRLKERLDKFPFKAVILAKATYTGDLELVKEKMLYEAGRLGIAQVNGIQIISETLIRNHILVRDIIEATTEGKADCQPREWKTLDNGTQRIIYLYGIYDVYPLSASVKLSNEATKLPVLVETHFIQSEYDANLGKLPMNIRQEIRTMLGSSEQANVEIRNNLNTVVQQEVQLLRSSGMTERKDALKNKFDVLKRQIETNRLDLVSKRHAYASAREKFLAHLYSEERVEIVTQSDLERNRSQDVIKAGLIRDCLTQFRTTVKSLYNQEKDKVVNFQLMENSSQNMFKQARLLSAKTLGIYLSPSEGDIKYTVSVAFRFGFDYVIPTKE